ncbi:polysaccharide biosynthesis/export family protein [Cognatiyoonia sp. IB215182]|uniref:polysaccharide biosynthesis/export family protein n=1 Tax=Cognatiyoonia sp. IB215182 TaxID=3097353 RepID=UPI002A0B0018|nr:polysaccharide biosynthesis/export family protein [Cognatiyoonia sp. IB215182]MDX8355000.1 polysaccharide biosynthesis/export family protein [Cognatiyoonia sp. IB215182]
MLFNRLGTFVLVLLLPVSLWAEGYRVGINDRLTVQIAVWDELNTTVTDLPGISGSYPVGAGGMISLPLAGSFPAADRTLDAIAADIEEALTAYVGIGQSAGAALSVERYAPIFISGEVKTPGVYDFTPGLTVQQALAMAGGAGTLEPPEGQERNFLSARGAIAMLQQELMFLTAKRDRLIGEIDGTTSVLPTETSNTTAWAAEEAILAARNARYEHELQSIARTKATLQEATAVLQDKLENNRVQLAAGQAELDREEELVERGLVASVRVFERASYVNELESRILDIERSLVLAQQDIQELERNESVLLAVRDEDNATKLQEVEAQIAETEAQLRTQYDLLSAAAGQQIALMAGVDPLTAEIGLTITRVRGGPATLSADMQTVMMPGDVVTVTYVAPATPSN